MTAQRVENVLLGDQTYQVVVEADLEDGGYTAAVCGLPGCITQAGTLEELQDMAKDAIRCWLEAYDDLKARGIDVPARK